MEYQHEPIDELIAKYLPQEASDSEKDILNAWTSQSEANKKYFADLKAIYGMTGEIFNQDTIDIGGAWSKFNKKLGAPKEKTPIIKKLTFSFYGKAAAILLVAGLGYFLYSEVNERDEEHTLASSSSYTLHDTLPDGTFVSLDQKSSLSYSPSFNKLNREVKLTGGAYFHVHHNGNLPFIVNAGGVLVKDIGTSFTIKANPSDSTVSVAVEEGKVSFYSGQRPGITLSANETGIYNKAANGFSKKEALISDNQPTSKTLVFKSMSLQSIVDTLNKTYKVNVVLACSKLKSLQLTATFNEETVSPIVETIAETLGLSITKTSGTILLDGDLCKN